jgi:hypothetical protein
MIADATTGTEVAHVAPIDGSSGLEDGARHRWMQRSAEWAVQLVKVLRRRFEGLK